MFAITDVQMFLVEKKGGREVYGEAEDCLRLHVMLG